MKPFDANHRALNQAGASNADILESFGDDARGVGPAQPHALGCTTPAYTIQVEARGARHKKATWPDYR